MASLDHLFVTTNEFDVEPVRGRVYSSLEAAKAAAGDTLIILTLFEFISRFPHHILVI